MNTLGISSPEYMFSYIVPVSGINGTATGKREMYNARKFANMDIRTVKGTNYMYLLAVPKPSIFDSANSRIYKELHPHVYRLERNLAGGRRSKSRSKSRSKRRSTRKMRH
jgi:hypothetical protein